MSEIIVAAKRGLYHRVLAELREGTEVDVLDTDNATPLYWAACGGHSDICRLLLSKGANSSLAVQWGSTPLHAAADRGHTDCIKYLLRYGALINAQNKNGDTPLHLAAFRGYVDACVVLLKHGASASILNNRGKTPQQEAQGALHQDIVNLFSEKKAAYRSASYPLATTDDREAIIPRPRLRASDSDDALLRAERKTRISLRKNLLSSSLEKQAVTERQGTRQIPSLNQLSKSDDSNNRHHHHHHRPFSDPTPAMFAGTREKFMVDDLSDPAKVSNIFLDEPAFHQKQEETERDHYLGAIDNLQLKVALLTSQKETLESKLREGSGSPRQEARRSEMEQTLQAMSEDLDKFREEKKAADAHSQQLASELFQLKNTFSSKINPVSLNSSQTNKSSTTDTALGIEQGISMYQYSHQRIKKESLALSICSYLEKPHLCRDNSLHLVFTQLQEDVDAVQTLKASTNQRLCDLRSNLNVGEVEALPDKPWILGADYKIVDGQPVDRKLKQINENGELSQMCFRVQHKNQTYIMKILLTPNTPESESVELSILRSLQKTPHPNLSTAYHHFDIQTTELRTLVDISKFVDDAFFNQLPDTTRVLIFPDYCTTLDHLLSCLSVETSSQFLQSWHSPNEVFILRLLLQLLKAICHLQDHGIAHRNINSKAVVLDWNLRLVLGEFNFATFLRNDDEQGILFVHKNQIGAGNPLAWSPELIQYSINGPPKAWQKVMSLQDVYESSDLYSVTAMLCILCNKSPLADKDTATPHGMVAKGVGSLNLKIPGCLSSEAQTLFEGLLNDNPAKRPTLKEAILRTGMILYGPQRIKVNSVQEMDAWMQAQDIRLLATPPHSNARDLDELARSLDWELCYDYLHCVSSTDLWQLCNEPLG